MTQNKPVRIVALPAQTHQTLVKAKRQIELATGHVITRLPKGNPQEL